MSSALDRKIAITFFENASNTSPTLCQLSLRSLNDHVRAHHEAKAADIKQARLYLPMIKLAELSGNRSTDSLVSISGVEGDVDSCIDLSFSVAKLIDAQIFAYIHTTSRHEEGCHRYRVLCPFSRPLKPEKWRIMHARLNRILGGKLDAAAAKPAQAYFIGWLDGTSEPEIYTVDPANGRCIDEFIEETEEDSALNSQPDVGADDNDPFASVRRAKKSGPDENDHEITRLKSALWSVSADCPYDDWWTYLCAIHATGWSCAEEIARDWSMSASGRWSAAAFRKAWKGLKSRRDDGITEATLFRRARAAGWVDEKRRADMANGPVGDISNSRRFADTYRHELLHDTSTGSWLRFETGIWKVCRGGEAQLAAKVLADEILAEGSADFAAAATPANKQRLSQSIALHTRASRLKSMLDLAVAEPGMSVPDSSSFDRDPWLLSVRGKVLDLRTGKPINSAPGLMISKCAGARYDPRADCPRWLSTLHQIFPDPEHVSFLKRAIGYSMTGSVDEEVLFIAHGHGANGKSVVANVLAGILGEYAVTVGAELLARSQNDNEAQRAKTRLVGARVALVNEVGQSDIWSDQRTKEIVSRESISARFMYRDPFEFFPTHKLWIRCNHLPGILDAGHGMWRRILVIPFNRQFGKSEQVPDLDRQLLRDEGPGILNWAIEGCLEYQSLKLQPPRSIADIVDGYREETDVVGGWLDEACNSNPHSRTLIAELYESYCRFHVRSGLRPASRPAFARLIRNRGFEKQRSNGKDYFTGISMKSDTSWLDSE